MVRPHKSKPTQMSRRRRAAQWLRRYGKQMATCIISLAAVMRATNEIVQIIHSMGWRI